MRISPNLKYSARTKTLQEEHAAADEAFEKLDYEYSQKRYQLVEAAKKKIDEALNAEYRFRLNELQQKRADAQEALNAQIDEDAKAQKPPFPLGTKLVGWGKRYTGYGHHDDAPEPLVTGILEVVTSKTQHRANLNYGRANIGKFIVRLLRKDGKPGIEYIEFESILHQWLPEGQTPKEPKKSKK